jgi:hypothetical protein
MEDYGGSGRGVFKGFSYIYQCNEISRNNSRNSGNIPKCKTDVSSLITRKFA